MGDLTEKRQENEHLTRVSGGAWQQRNGAFRFIDTFWTVSFFKILKLALISFIAMTVCIQACSCVHSCRGQSLTWVLFICSTPHLKNAFVITHVCVEAMTHVL